jgi:serine protease Do
MVRWFLAGKRAALSSILGMLSLLPWVFVPGRVAGAETTATSAPAAELATASLDRLLAGASPMGLADLRVMQDHVRKLTDQLMKCTVGVQVGNAQGSGVIISKDGYVLTAAHVAGKPKRDVMFIMSDGRMLRGKTLGLNRTLDSGLMKIDGQTDLPFAEMGASDGLKDGQWCLATGHPGGYQSDRQPVLRLGRVLASAKDAITTDCTLVGGDSGGPLFDLRGKVIGVNSRIAGPLTANMHVPVATYKDTWDRLTKADAWGHFPGNDPYIGVKGDPDVKAAKILSVSPGSPAEQAKLQAGDVIIGIDDEDVTDFESLVRIIAEHQPKDDVQVVVKRGEETLRLALTIGKKKE